MKLRAIQKDDFEELKVIYKQYYEHEFEFPDFVNHFMCACAVVDNDNQIITAGGIRTITEAIVMTDKATTSRIRREALFRMLEVFRYVTSNNNYTEIHAFVQDKKWYDSLVKHGFRPTKGRALVIDV